MISDILTYMFESPHEDTSRILDLRWTDVVWTKNARVYKKEQLGDNYKKKNGSKSQSSVRG